PKISSSKWSMRAGFCDDSTISRTRASAKLRRRNSLAEHLASVGHLAAIGAGGTRYDHERQQVLFARVHAARTGRRFPSGEPRVTLGAGQRDRLSQPGVERLGFRVGLRRAEAAHVVVAHAAADNEHALVAQGGERAT